MILILKTLYEATIHAVKEKNLEGEFSSENMLSIKCNCLDIASASSSTLSALNDSRILENLIEVKMIDQGTIYRANIFEFLMSSSNQPKYLDYNNGISIFN